MLFWHSMPKMTEPTVTLMQKADRKGFLFQLLQPWENTVIRDKAPAFGNRLPPDPQLWRTPPEESVPLRQPCVRGRTEEEVHQGHQPAAENHNSHHHSAEQPNGNHRRGEDLRRCGDFPSCSITDTWGNNLTKCKLGGEKMMKDE